LVNDRLLWRLRASQHKIPNLKYQIQLASTVNPENVDDKVPEFWPKDMAALGPVVPPRSSSQKAAKDDVPRRAISQQDERENLIRIQLF
jgi:hypothetical protein